MSPTTDEGDNQTKCLLRDLARDMARQKWLFGKCLYDNKTENAFTLNDQDTATMVRLRQALSRDPDALHELFDVFRSAVFNRSSDNKGDIMAAFRCLSLSAIIDVCSFDALRTRVKATTVDIPAPELIEHLLKKFDDDGGDCGYNDGGHGEGLFVCAPVANATGKYGALAGWPTRRRVTKDLQVALNTARWIDSWGVGRYRSGLVFNARRSAFFGQLPYEIGWPRYLVEREKQTRAKMALRLGRQPDNPAIHVSACPLCSWKPLVLGVVALVVGYMAYRCRVFKIWPPTYYRPIGVFGQFATKRGISKS